MSTTSPILGFPEVQPNQTQKETTINTGLEALESATQGALSVSLSSGSVTLNATQWTEAFFYTLTGATVARTLTVPATKRLVCFKNTGSATVTVTTGSGTTAVLLAGACSAVYCDGTNMQVVSAAGSGPLTVSTQTASYTTVIGDAQSLILMNSASGVNLTIPPSSSVAYTPGTQITVLQDGVGQVTAVPGAGVTFLFPADMSLISRRQYSVLTFINVGTDIWSMVGDTAGTQVRPQISGNISYFVRTDGNDSNTGLVNSSGGAFLTIQAAINAVYALDLNHFVATINIGTGTFTAGFLADGPFTGGQGIAGVIINGNGAANTIIAVSGSTHAFTVQNAAKMTFQNMKLTGGTGQAFRVIEIGTNVAIGAGMEFGTWTGGRHFNCARAATIQILSSYTISGGAAIHMAATLSGVIFTAASLTATITGTPAFSTAFISINLQSQVGLASGGTLTWSGSATGTQYTVTQCSVLDTGGHASSIPGTAASGTFDSTSSVD